MENDLGEFYLYIEQTPGELGEFVKEFTNQEDIRMFAEGRQKENPDRIGRGYRMKPNNSPVEIML